MYEYQHAIHHAWRSCGLAGSSMSSIAGLVELFEHIRPALYWIERAVVVIPPLSCIGQWSPG